MSATDAHSANHEITLALCGDVMTGRGVDQILPHPVDPQLYESYVRSARTYVALAERANGPIPHPVDFAYPWGELLPALQRLRPDAWIVNLETAVTTSATPWPDKGIHYRMHPANLPCLTAARIDACCLANNHVLDWGWPGLAETLATLHRSGLRTAGAGASLDEAAAPAVIDLHGKGRLLLFGCATGNSGVPSDWAASAQQPGVHRLPDLSLRSVEAIAHRVQSARQPGDIALLSIHWGGNWGYAVSKEERAFAHALIDHAGIDLLHGHSSHHVRAVEVWHERLILYGCGDLLTDYEGIGGHEAYRPELSLVYLPVLQAGSGQLLQLDLLPTELRKMQLHLASHEGAGWLCDVLDREGSAWGVLAQPDANGLLRISWPAGDAGMR